MDIALTPVGEGRFEVYLNGREVYSRKQPPQSARPAGDLKAAVDVAQGIRTQLLSVLKGAAIGAGSGGP